ncbi:MAG TPA: hypothetical protein DCX54_03120 [Flavobacteriales bacterium]|nr:hypothetical protein [Flavobacteriales bacterium]
MKKNYTLPFLILLFITLSVSSYAQDREFGFFVGGSYYNGELNPSKHVVKVARPAFGVLYDVHINSRYYFRTIASYGKISANDQLTEIGLNNFRDLQLEARVLDLSGQIHFNFLPFGNSINVKTYTPYIFVGLSVYNVNPQISSMNSDSAAAAPKESYSRSLTRVAVPFGVGFKKIFGTLTLGLEWNFRKTFTDKFDGLDDQYSTGNLNGEPVQYNHPSGFQKSMLNTPDWYSFIGFTVTFRPLPKKNSCPGLN